MYPHELVVTATSHYKCTPVTVQNYMYFIRVIALIAKNSGTNKGFSNWESFLIHFSVKSYEQLSSPTQKNHSWGLYVCGLVDILWKKLEKKISREWPELEVYSEESSCLFFAVNS